MGHACAVRERNLAGTAGHGYRIGEEQAKVKWRRSAADHSGMNDLERANAELRAALIIAGKGIVKLDFGRRDDQVLPILRRVLRESRQIDAPRHHLASAASARVALPRARLVSGAGPKTILDLLRGIGKHHLFRQAVCLCGYAAWRRLS
jgi:hypothetical protein